jgi:hypothetical protein
MDMAVGDEHSQAVYSNASIPESDGYNLVLTEKPMKIERLLLFVLFATILSAAQARPQAAASSKTNPVTMEYYYKVKWGFQDEFLKLFEKNHLPILRKIKERGEIHSIKVEKPTEHATEDGRWDYRVTIVFRDFEAAFGDKSGDYEMTKKMYPDWATFEKEEQRRFEILLAHWDMRMEDITPE